MSFFSGLWAAAKWVWNGFSDFCATIAPGLKTFIISAVGLLGSVGASLQEYLTGVPLDHFVTAEKVLYINMILFTLVFFARHLTNVSSSQPNS